MTRIFITGSTTGLGLLAAEKLLAAGHNVILHARNPDRAAALRQRLPSVAIVTGDLSSQTETLDVARQVGELGAVDAVIHNAGLFGGPIAPNGSGPIPHRSARSRSFARL